MTGGAGMTARASAGEGTGSGSSATAGVSAVGGLSRGVERSMTASNVSATPPGSAIHRRLRRAETVGPGICWTREAGWKGGSGGGTLPCHSHKPDRWFSSLGELCPTTRSRAPPQDPKCGGDRRGRLERSLPVLGRSTFPGSAITLSDRNSSARECVNGAVKAHD